MLRIKSTSKRLIPVLSLILFVSNTVNAQRIEQDLDKAGQLQGKFPKEQVVCLLSETVYNFYLSRDGERIEVSQETEQRFISLVDYTTFSTYIFYDENSEIGRLDIRGKNNKKTNISSLDKEYNGEGIFHSDGRIKHYELGFDTKGEIKRSYYYKTYNNIVYFPTVYFQENFPIAEKILIFNIPDWLDIEFVEYNFDGYDIQTESKNNVKEKLTTITYRIKNLETPPDDYKQPGPSYFMPHTLILTKGYYYRGQEKKLFSSIDDVYTWYQGLIDPDVKDSEIIISKVNELIIDKESDEDKIRAIYYWIQDNIRYIAFEDGLAGFKPEDPEKVFINKYGDCKGMANLLKQMLIIAGYKARLSWLGTKHIAYSYDIPSLAVDNHMICTLFLDCNKVYLDPTEDFIPYRNIAERIQGKQIMIEDGDSYILEVIPEFGSSANCQKTMMELSIADNSLLKGTIDIELEGESKMNFQRNFSSLKSSNKDDALRYYLGESDKNINISNVGSIGLDNRDVPLVISCDIELSNQITSFDNDIYVSIDMDKELEHFDIDSTRICDVVFGHKLCVKTEISLEIPNGYRVSHSSKDLFVSHEDFYIDIKFVQAEKKLTYLKTIEIFNAIVRKNDFSEWNEMIAKLKKLYDDQIVLSKE